MLTSTAPQSSRRYRRGFLWFLAACAFILVGTVTMGALRLTSETTTQLVIAAVGVEDSRRALLPVSLQRRIAKAILRQRHRDDFEPDLDDPSIVLALPLIVAAMEHYPGDQGAVRYTDRKNALEVAEILHGRGIHVDKLDHFGCTSLQSMAMEGDSEFFAFLLQLGADPDFRNLGATAETCRASAAEILTNRQ